MLQRSPVDDLAHRVEQAPARWAPVAGLLVAQHPHTLAVAAGTVEHASVGAGMAAWESPDSVHGPWGSGGCGAGPGTGGGCTHASSPAGVAYFGPLLHACAQKVDALLRADAHLRLAEKDGGGTGAGGPGSATAGSAASSLVWLLRCLCELARATGPLLAATGGGVGLQDACLAEHALGAARRAWQSVVDSVALGLCGHSFGGGGGWREVDQDSKEATQCVPTLLAAEMATLVVAALKAGVAAPSMPAQQLLWHALRSAGACWQRAELVCVCARVCMFACVCARPCIFFALTLRLFSMLARTCLPASQNLLAGLCLLD